MKLKARMLLIGIGSMVCLTSVLLVAAWIQNNRFVALTEQQLLAAAQQDLQHVAEASYRSTDFLALTADDADLAVHDTAIREAIMSAKVGKTGYVWVLGTKGEARGKYIISLGGKRDGEYIMDSKDPYGGQPVKYMIETGEKLGPGEVSYYRYWWKNASDKQPRRKLVAMCYYAPRGWLIGAGAYEDEFLTSIADMKAAGRKMLLSIAGVGILATALATLAFGMFSARISRRLETLTVAAKAVAAGDTAAAGEVLDSEKAA